MDDEPGNKLNEIQTETIMDGKGLLVFLKKSGVDVNATIAHVLRSANTNATPDILVQRIFKDENSQLVRFFDIPEQLIISLRSSSTESIQELTTRFQDFVLNVLIQNKRTNQKKSTDAPMSEEEENSVLLSELMRKINTLKTRWSDNYDELTEFILDFLSLLDTVYQDPEPGSAHRYEYDPDEEEANEEFFSDDSLQPQMNESEYIPYNLLNTIV